MGPVVPEPKLTNKLCNKAALEILNGHIIVTDVHVVHPLQYHLFVAIFLHLTKTRCHDSFEERLSNWEVVDVRDEEIILSFSLRYN
jgi:hypothetical protein